MPTDRAMVALRRQFLGGGAVEGCIDFLYL
jgi:hypothetical protein